MSDPDESSSKATAWRWLRRLALALLAVEVLWLVVANVMLAGPLSALFSGSPEKLVVRWESAWSAYPTHVHVRGFYLRNQSRRMQMEIEIGEVDGRIGLLPLVTRRIAIRGASGSGVEVRARHRLDAAERYAPYAPHMPPIEGLDNPPTDPPVRKRENPPVWTVSFENLGWVSGDEIWIDAFRVGPGLSVRGSAEIVPREHFVLSDLDAVLQAVDAVALGEPFAIGLTGQAHVAMSPIPMKQSLAPGETWELPLDDPDLTLDLDGEMAAAPLADLLTAGLDWFAIEGGTGPLSAHVEVEDGRLLDGSQVDLVLPDLALRLTEFRLVGAADCRWELVEEREEGEAGGGWRLTIAGSEIEGQRLDPPLPLLRAESLDVRLTGGDRRLAEYRQDTRLAVRLDGGAIDDLTPWAAYVPAKTGLELRHGHGTVTARLDADTETDRGEASADVRLSDVELDYFGETVAGRADLALRLPVLVLDERRYALDGSKLSLTATDLEPSWEGTFTLDDGWLTPGRDPSARVSASLEASDARPAVALYLAKKNLPGWIARLISVKSLTGRTDLSLGPSGVDLGPFVLDGEHVEVEGVLTLRDQHPDGLFYARYRALKLGLQVDGKQHDFQVAHPKRWYDERMAERE